TCVMSNQCADSQKDGNETDTDCGGGTCLPCSINLRCSLNSDCTSNACGASSLTCVSNQCIDQRKDGNETDIDCGGGACTSCSGGRRCLLSSDCASAACDAVSLTCVSNQCSDHRKDG